MGEWSNCTAIGAESESSEMEEQELEDESGSAGNGSCPGVMLRNVFCQQTMGSDLLSIVDEELCEGEKPAAQKLCSDDEEPQDSEPKVLRTFQSCKIDKLTIASNYFTIIHSGLIELLSFVVSLRSMEWL